ncbi:hypothetical protein PG993_005314 [Apiospora rasikravindrae]|uniref:Uncharacterized protein n=1 Tax=Apiospora rasikravindrae TaxID=990691 RepID=A0ABR1TH78_9PEZI
MEFFKSFGRKRQSKAVTPLAIPTGAGSGQQPKAKSNATTPSQQQTPNRQNNGSDPPGLTGPSFRQVCWGSNSPSYQASSFEGARGGESPFGTPFDRRREVPTTNNAVIEPPEFNLSAAPSSGLGIQQKTYYGPLGNHDSGQPSPLSLDTPEKQQQQYISTPTASCEVDNREPRSQKSLAENFFARTHAPKPSLGRRGAIYVSPKRERHEISPSRRADEPIERYSFAEDGVEISLTRNPPKSVFLGNNMKRWETLLAQQTAAALSELAEKEEEEEDQQQEDIGEGEPSGIGNRANEEAVDAVRRLGRGEFQGAFSDYERAHTRSATLQQLQRQRTRSPGSDEDSDQSEEPGSSRHRARSV